MVNKTHHENKKKTILSQSNLKLFFNTMNAIALSHFCSQNDLEFGYAILLKQIGLLSAEGDDAIHFIHGQLSNDIEHLGTDSVRLAAYCTPQGKILALFHIWKSEQKLWMTLSKDILSSLQKRFQGYILRAKVKLTDESNNMILWGIGGKQAESALSKCFSYLPLNMFEKTDGKIGTLMRVSNAFDTSRYLLAVPNKHELEVKSFLSTKLNICDENNWCLGDIEAGIPQITLPIQDRFIPQMLNLEEVSALSFKKGCYPGQEIIARSQYRGTIKRKMFHGYIEQQKEESPFFISDITTGTDLFDAQGLCCGTIIQVAQRNTKRIDCLAVIQREAKKTGIIHARTPNGPVLSWVPLPYPLNTYHA